MKNLLKTFIQKYGSHCLLMLCLLEPLYRDVAALSIVFKIMAVIVLFFFLIYPLVIEPILIALRPNRKYDKESKESLLFTIYICLLGILSQYLSSPEGLTFNSLIAFYIVIIVASICDLIPDHIKKSKKQE